MIAQIEQFQRELNLSSSAKKYLQDRFFDSTTVEQFNIGFCPSCSSFNFDLLNGRIVVPIFDVYGEHIAFAGRKLDNYSTDVKDFYQQKTSDLVGLNKFLKWKTSKWINTPYTKANHLYNLDKAKKHIFDLGFCVIVEGYFDVMRLSQLGYKNVVALCGTSLTSRQCELIYRYTNKILIMLDGDEARKTATNKTIFKARANNIFANVIDMPENLDPDDLDQETLEIIFNEIINSDEEVYIKL